MTAAVLVCSLTTAELVLVEALIASGVAVSLESSQQGKKEPV